jgi:hypothetical protein
MSFTPAEIQTIGDINYRARTTLKLQSGELERLLVLSGMLKQGTYQQWPNIDADPRLIIGIMFGTSDVRLDAYNADLMTKFANAIHVAPSLVERPLLPPAGPTVPDTGTTTPPATNTDDAAKIALLESRLAAMEAKLSTMVQSGAVNPLLAATPQAFQWPTPANGWKAPDESGGPQGEPAQPFVLDGSFVSIANAAPAGSSATSGPNQQSIGIAGRSKGKIRVNTNAGADGDGGARRTTNYIALAPRPGVGTVTRKGFKITCSVPDAISINTAIWTKNPDGSNDAGVFIVRRNSPTEFVGNWSDPAMDYENRAFITTGADQPDRDRFSVKDGADSNAGFGWRVDKPRNSTENHPTYKEDPVRGFTDGGDFLVRLHHDKGNDIAKYSTYKTYNEGRGMKWATSNGNYGDIRDVMGVTPGANGQPGKFVVDVDGSGLQVVKARADGSLYVDGERPVLD